MRETMRRLSARPHHVGSPYDKENAEWIAGAVQGMGLGRADRDASTCSSRRRRSALLEMVAPTRFAAGSRSRRSRIDPTIGQKAEQLPTYNAYSIDGDVTGPLVYVNYGVPDDYEQLERRGISVKGAIVHRALRRFVARHQAEGGGRARRGGLPHLLGSARRRLLRGRRLSRRARAPAATACSAAA